MAEQCFYRLRSFVVQWTSGGAVHVACSLLLLPVACSKLAGGLR
jgi:hypothetical protein